MTILITASVCLLAVALLVLLAKRNASRKSKIKNAAKRAASTYSMPPKVIDHGVGESHRRPVPIKRFDENNYGNRYHRVSAPVTAAPVSVIKTEQFDAPSDDFAVQSLISAFPTSSLADVFSVSDSPSTDTSSSSDSFSGGGGDFGGGGASSDW